MKVFFLVVYLLIKGSVTHSSLTINTKERNLFDKSLEEEVNKEIKETFEDLQEELDDTLAAEEEGEEEEEVFDGNAEGVEREARMRKFTLPLECVTHFSNISKGTCMTHKNCAQTGGTASGPCGQRAKGLTCCLMEKTCSGTTARNNTNFINAGYPSSDSGTGACSLTINRYNDNICQMRFDFIKLELSQPDTDGNCVTDFLTVTGGTSASPIICGSNSGQHMYVELDPEGGAVRLTVDRTAASMSERMWNVQVSQIECTSKYKAPAGCLQYFTETSGTVSSFNFNQNINDNAFPMTTRQIVDMNYAVCVKMAEGYCSIMWSRNTSYGDYAFTVSANIAGLSKSLIGDPVSSSTSNKCTTDYVIIPGAVDDLGIQNDRYCGAGFPNSVTSNLRPFIMFVTTDSNERGDVLNRGFSLNYRQTIC